MSRANDSTGAALLDRTLDPIEASVDQWCHLPFFGSRCPFTVTNPQKRYPDHEMVPGLLPELPWGPNEPLKGLMIHTSS